MHQPLINILIRVSRPDLFKRCIQSIDEQTYRNINLIVGLDNRKGSFEIGSYKRNYDVAQDHYWNTFCNDLKAMVKDGLFFYMDDDDYLAGPDVIQQLVSHISDDTEGLIVQFLRNGKPKPSNFLIDTKVIKKGLIGGGCLVLHAKHKNVADWEAKRAADFDWIYAVAREVPLKFVPLVVQIAGNNGLHGRTDTDPGSCSRGGIKVLGASCSFNDLCTYPNCKP